MKEHHTCWTNIKKHVYCTHTKHKTSFLINSIKNMDIWYKNKCLNILYFRKVSWSSISICLHARTSETVFCNGWDTGHDRQLAQPIRDKKRPSLQQVWFRCIELKVIWLRASWVYRQNRNVFINKIDCE